MGKIFAQTIEVSEGNLWNRRLKWFEGDQAKINGMGVAAMASTERGTEIGIPWSVVMCVALWLYQLRVCGIFGHRCVLAGQQIER